MIEKCFVHLYRKDLDLGYFKGYFDSLHQIGVFNSALLKKEAFGLPRGTKVYINKKNVPVIVVDAETHLATNYGESMIPDPDLVDVLTYFTEDKQMKFMGSINIELWQMLALMGAGAGVLGGIQLILQIFNK